jgi:hypothetical protein
MSGVIYNEQVNYRAGIKGILKQLESLRSNERLTVEERSFSANILSKRQVDVDAKKRFLFIGDVTMMTLRAGLQIKGTAQITLGVYVTESGPVAELRVSAEVELEIYNSILALGLVPVYGTSTKYSIKDKFIINEF